MQVGKETKAGTEWERTVLNLEPQICWVKCLGLGACLYSRDEQWEQKCGWERE